MEARTYFCIDMKSFYASVECAERGLNPFETNLVVADVTRGKNALCLAVSPKLKSQGVGGRARISEIPKTISYIAAPPQMKLYIEYAADIYALYLQYFAPQDIHVYSIDESFIDVTGYLKTYKTDARTLAKKLMNEIAATLKIPSTAGIGSNLFLAKVALDITAKHAGDHIGFLDEQTFRKTMWDHKPITDFWQIAKGTANRLSRYGIYTMRDITQTNPALLYQVFGVNAELLIDHAWGRESCRMEDIKSYRGKSKSVSFSQILPRDYTAAEAKTVLAEMLLHGCQEMMRRKVITALVWVGVGYSKERHESTHGTVRLTSATSAYSLIRPCALSLYDRIVVEDVPVRRLGISFADVCDEGCAGYDFFTDWAAVEKEKAREKAVLELQERFGKNAVLRGSNFLKEATQRERNEMIGGHKAGYDDQTGAGKAVSAL